MCEGYFAACCIIDLSSGEPYPDSIVIMEVEAAAQLFSKEYLHV